MTANRVFAICAYVLDKNVHGFFDHMKQCVEYSLKELQHMATNEPLVNMDYGYYQDILYALSSGIIDYVKNITIFNEKVNLKKPKPPAVPLYFHKAFRLLILGRDATYHDLEEMEEVFAKKEKSFFRICAMF